MINEPSAFVLFRFDYNLFLTIPKLSATHRFEMLSKIDCYNIYSMYSERQACANGVDPSRMPQNAVCDQGRQVLQLILQSFTHNNS